MKNQPDNINLHRDQPGALIPDDEDCLLDLS
jgi:hypothetical protein